MCEEVILRRSVQSGYLAIIIIHKKLHNTYESIPSGWTHFVFFWNSYLDFFCFLYIICIHRRNSFCAPSISILLVEIVLTFVGYQQLWILPFAWVIVNKTTWKLHTAVPNGKPVGSRYRNSLPICRWNMPIWNKWYYSPLQKRWKVEKWRITLPAKSWTSYVINILYLLYSRHPHTVIGVGIFCIVF